MTWYLTKITVPCGVSMIHALGDNCPAGQFSWGKVERLRQLSDQELEELHRAENELMKAWAKTLPTDI